MPKTVKLYKYFSEWEYLLAVHGHVTGCNTDNPQYLLDTYQIVLIKDIYFPPSRT